MLIKVGGISSHKPQHGNQKKTLFQKYFPMFFDAWHLAKHLQYHAIALILAVSIGSVLAYPIAVFLMSICFIGFYK